MRWPSVIPQVHRYRLTLVLWLMALLPVACAQEAPELALPMVFFTDTDQVEEGTKDRSLLSLIKDLIDNTPAGEEITVCIFKFGVKDLADALIAANDRGVRVRVILNDGKTSEDVNEDVEDLLSKELSAFYFIENTISKKGILHNKFILFSEVTTSQGPVQNLVLQTSSNFQKKGSKKLQDLLLFSNRAIYYGYLDFWYNIRVLGEVGQLDHYRYQHASDEKDLYKAYFYPKIRNKEPHGKDNVLEALKDIKNPEDAKIYFAHGKWSENRVALVRELEELIEDGASVSVVTNGDVDEEVKDAFDNLSKQVQYLDDDVNMHTKFFLIDEGKKRRVWTGSHNLTERSLRENFEVLLRIEDTMVYEAYLEYFKKIRKLASP